MGRADDVSRSRLDSGLRIVTERLEALRSVALGCWVGTGSRDEPAHLAGTSHFLEHLLFKGTARRGAAEIAAAVESVGGEMNAFTTQEATAFHLRLPDSHLELGVEILSDIVWSPAFRPNEVEAERQVILEEIRMHDDAPEDVVHSLFAGALFPGHPIGREVIGSEASITAIERDDIATFHAAHYQPGNVVIAAAGNVEHERVVKLFADSCVVAPADRPTRAAYEGRIPPLPLSIVERATEQVHLVLGTRALSARDPDRHALTVLNHVLGGGMSSRLFQEVREERGLAYSVYSYRGAMYETGVLAIYAGTAPERLDELLDVLERQLARLTSEGGVTERELEDAKGYLQGSLALGLESSGSRMHRIGRSELTLGEVPSLDELVARVQAVTADDVARVIDRVLAPQPWTLAVVGPVTADRVAGRFGSASGIAAHG